MRSLDSIANTLFHTLQFMRKGFHIPAYLLVGNPGVYLRGLDVRISKNPAHGFNGYAVRQQNSGRRKMSCDMIGQPGLDTALLAYLFQPLVATTITRHGKNTVIARQAFVFLYYSFGNVQQPDIGVGVGFAPAGNNPQAPSKNVCRLSVVSFFTSAYDNPVKTEKTKRSRTNSYVLFFIEASISV